MHLNCHVSSCIIGPAAVSSAGVSNPLKTLEQDSPCR